MGIFELIAVCVFFSSVSAIYKVRMDARVKMVELQAQNRDNLSSAEQRGLREEVAALRAQMEQLRDTTTQYDLSFDSALQRMEQRLTHVERKTQGQNEEYQSVAPR